MSSRRTRGRGNSRGRQQNIRNQQMDSNGPGGRLRGTPQQVLDRYLALARDASAAGDTVLAENLWQHAEHYTRLLNAAAPPQQQPQQHPNQQNQPYANGQDPDDGGIAAGDEGAAEPIMLPPVSSDPLDSNSAQPEDAAQPNTPDMWNGTDANPQDAQQPLEQAQPAPRRRRRRLQRPQDTAGEGNGSFSGDGDHAEPAGELPLDIAPPLQLGGDTSADGDMGDAGPGRDPTTAEPV